MADGTQGQITVTAEVTVIRDGQVVPPDADTAPDDGAGQ